MSNQICISEAKKLPESWETQAISSGCRQKRLTKVARLLLPKDRSFTRGLAEPSGACPGNQHCQHPSGFGAWI